MISRRNAVKLGAVGLATSALVGSKRARQHETAQIISAQETRSISTIQGGATRNGRAVGPAPDFSKPLHEKWRFPSRFGLFSWPAVSKKIVYAATTGGELFAIDMETGREKWRLDRDFSLTTHPTVVDDTLYIGSHDTNFYAFDAVTGEEKWRFATAGAIEYSATFHESTLFAGSGDGNIYALDAASGMEKWRFDLGSQENTSAWTTPAVSDGIVVAKIGHLNMFGLDSESGRELWRNRNESEVDPMPVIEAGIVYWSAGGGVTALDLSTGKELRRFDWAATLPLAVVDGIAFATGKELRAYEVDSGNQLWAHELPRSASASPIITGNYVFACAYDRDLHVLSTETGELLWNWKGDGVREGYPPKVINIADGMIFVNDETELVALGN